MVPTEVQGELKHLYAAAGELLRHFWSCFPVNTPFLEEKVTNNNFVERDQIIIVTVSHSLFPCIDTHDFWEQKTKTNWHF